MFAKRNEGLAIFGNCYLRLKSLRWDGMSTLNTFRGCACLICVARYDSFPDVKLRQAETKEFKTKKIVQSK